MKLKIVRDFAPIFILILLLTSCLSNTEFVKESIFEDDYTLKIGDVFDNYKYFDKTTWEEFTTDQGRDIVEFNGYYTQADFVIEIQFAINKDRKEDSDGNAIELFYVGYKLPDGREEPSSLYIISYIYRNKELPLLKSILSNTDFIKESFLKDDYTLKIGDVFDNYKYFNKTEWREFTAEQGIDVVDFKGYYYQADIVVQIQFAFNEDRKEDADGNAFQMMYAGYILPDGKEIVKPSIVSNIYNNEECYGFLNYAKRLGYIRDMQISAKELRKEISLDFVYDYVNEEPNKLLLNPLMRKRLVNLLHYDPTRNSIDLKWRAMAGAIASCYSLIEINDGVFHMAGWESENYRENGNQANYVIMGDIKNNILYYGERLILSTAEVLSEVNGKLPQRLEEWYKIEK